MTPSKSDGVVLGVVYGLVAAVTYTLANLALRKVATTGDLDWAVWVSANKALPVTIVAWLIVVWRLWQGLPALPPHRCFYRWWQQAFSCSSAATCCSRSPSAMADWHFPSR